MSKAREKSGRREPLPEGVAGLLKAVSDLHLKVRLLQFPVLAVACLSLAWLLQGTVDRYFRLSWATRACLLTIDGIAVLVLLIQYVFIPTIKRLNRRRAALLVERELPGFDSALISAVDFCEASDGYPERSGPLVRELLDKVAHQVADPEIPRRAVDSRPLRMRVSWAIAAVIMLLLAAGFAGLRMTYLLGSRIFLSQVALPADSQVTPLTGSFMVDAGADAALAVQVTGMIPAKASLIITSGGETTTIPVPVTHEGEANLYRYTVKNVRQLFTYRFVANDGESPEAKVKVNVPPTLKSIRFVQDYPDYTGLPQAVMSPGNLRFLEGSHVRVEIVASEELESSKLVIKGSDDLVTPFKSTGQPDTYALDLTVPGKGWKTMSVHLNAGEDRVSSNEPVYRIDLVTDRPPSAVMLLPKKDRITVIPGTKVPLSFKAADDFGFHSLCLSYRVMRPDANGALTPAEERQVRIPFDKAQRNFSGEQTFNLGELLPPVPAGCSITCWLEADDNDSLKNFQRTTSKEKVIAVVTEEEKRMELLELMEQRAKDVERLYDQQRSMNQRAEDSLNRK